MLRQVTLEQVIQTSQDAFKASLYISMPGAVTAYDASSMTASVQPMLNDPRTNLETDGIEMEPWPVLTHVPVAWPRFGGFVLCGPLNVGDPVTLEAWDLDPSAVFKQGAGSTHPVDPTDIRRLGGNYWRARPENMASAIKDAAEAAAAFLLGLDGDVAQILIAAASLTIGKTGCAVSLSGGGAKIGRVGDSVSVKATIIAPNGGGPCTIGSGSDITIPGTITGGSPNVTSG